jgi:hypothetical protein
MAALATFIAFPWAALVCAAFLTVLWWWSRSKVAVAAAIVWVAYAGYEYLMFSRVLCTGECNIRVDLLLIYPLLLLGSVAAIIHSIWARGVSRRAA